MYIANADFLTFPDLGWTDFSLDLCKVLKNLDGCAVLHSNRISGITTYHLKFRFTTTYHLKFRFTIYYLDR